MSAYKNISLILCILFSFNSLQSEIIEISNMQEIHSYIKPNTLIVFDIDNTLVEPVQELGSDQWFYHQLESYLESGMLLDKALKKTLAEWSAMQQLTAVKIVEPGSEKIIHNLQDEGFKAIGLTTRGLELSECTKNQLETLKIDLSLTAPSQADVFFNNLRGVLFYKGILFTCATHKGTALFKFLDLIDYSPSHIVFINDKASHLKDIEETCEDRNIPFIGLRYGFLDKKVKNFQKDVAEIQFQQFGNFLSNEEASKILQNR